MAAIESTSTSVNNSSINFLFNESIILIQGSSTNAQSLNVNDDDSLNSNNELAIGDDGVDPPRDSGIDLGASSYGGDGADEDILDLDRFEEMDDEESWYVILFSPKLFLPFLRRLIVYVLCILV